MSEVLEIGRRARSAARALATCSTKVKNEALALIADQLEADAEVILKANAGDVARAHAEGVDGAIIDRLTLDGDRVGAISHAVRELIALPDPVGQVVDAWTQADGLYIEKIRVPLGVVGMIYEARPNVTVDAATICLKAGNACILRGSSTAIDSNISLADAISRAIAQAGLPIAAVQLITDTSRESAKELMRMREYVDVLIPRGGAGLIRTVVEESTVPVIETGVGNCHIYVDAAADLDNALPVLLNAKTQRTSVCNAAESLLVHDRIAGVFLPAALAALKDAGVEVRGDDRTQAVDPSVVPATDDDHAAEFLDMIISVKVVDSLDAAIDHINTFGTQHTDAIITEDAEAARRFAAEVDSACVVVNASTRFADGGEFGFGAEIGISNQKLHARGPMALPELTSYKYVVTGHGQVRR